MAMSAEPEHVKSTPSNFLNMDSGAEIARQMDQDLLITRAMGGLFAEHPDLMQVQQVLDVCCGPGGWALELAFMYPHLGFDIVNARFISSFLSVDDWPCVVCELARVVKPGGIVRLTEFDEPGVSNSPAHEKMKQLYGRALKQSNQSFYPLSESPHRGITPMLEKFLRDAGCLYICEQAHVINYSAGKRAAVRNYENLKVVYKLGQPFLVATGVATQEELDKLYDQMLLEMLSDNFRALWYFLSVWGYKPE